VGDVPASAGGRVNQYVEPAATTTSNTATPARNGIRLDELTCVFHVAGCEVAGAGAAIGGAGTIGIVATLRPTSESSRLIRIKSARSSAAV